MPTANVNILAVIVAAVLTFVLGAVWYSPVLFAKQWMAAQGYTPEKLEEMKRKGVTRAYAVSVLCYLVTAYVMALLASYTNSTTLAQGLWLGFLFCLRFPPPRWLPANIVSEEPIPPSARRILLPRHDHEAGGLAGSVPHRRLHVRRRARPSRRPAPRLAVPRRDGARRRPPVADLLQPGEGRGGRGGAPPAVRSHPDLPAVMAPPRAGPKPAPPAPGPGNPTPPR